MGVDEALDKLCTVFGRVALVSGRPVSFLAEQVPPAVDLVGLYGAERRISGEFSEDPRLSPWRSVVADVAKAACSDGPQAMRVEDKGLSITLHYREAPELADEVHRWAEAAAADSGLHRQSARMSEELHPPVAVNKGTVVEELARDLSAVVYCGDDAGDLPAFEALDSLAAEGKATLKVVAEGAETPPAVRNAADYLAAGPRAVAEAVIELAARLT